MSHDAATLIAAILAAPSHGQVLGLDPRSASKEEIKQRYKQYSLIVHPDRCSLRGAQAACQRVIEAQRELLNRAPTAQAWEPARAAPGARAWEPARAAWEPARASTRGAPVRYPPLGL